MPRALQKFLTWLHTATFRLANGKFVGRFRNAKFLLLHTTGRKSGKQRVTPLNYCTDGADFVVIASNGGAKKHPDWYLNLEANPKVEVELGDRRVPAVAEIATGPERDRVWRIATSSWRFYDSYQRRTERDIPVVVLRPVAD